MSSPKVQLVAPLFCGQSPERQGRRGFARGAYTDVRDPKRNASLTPYFGMNVRKIAYPRASIFSNGLLAASIKPLSITTSPLPSKRQRKTLWGVISFISAQRGVTG